MDFDKYVSDHPDDFVQTRIDLQTLPVLEWGAGNRRGEFDKDNARKLYESLSQLSAVEAADERLWVSLALGHYADYFHNRWPCSPKTDLTSHLNSHLFAPDTRRRFRDQAIARLWWVGRFIRRNLADIEDKAYSVFYDIEADVLSQLTTRPTLVSVRHLAKAVIQVSYDGFLNSESSTLRTYSRDGFRKFLIELDMENGRQLAPHRDYEDLLSLVNQCFNKHLPEAVKA
jgi:hypothetical protein